MNMQININNRLLTLSNLDKVLYPADGLTKSGIIQYYSRSAPCLLPHLKDRALTFKRYPNGVNAEFFYEKRCPGHKPSWVQTAVVPYGSRKTMTVCLVNNLETLIWAANLASLELHVPLAKAVTPDHPDSVVFDLDPGEGADFSQCAKIAILLKELFDGMKLESVVKTSGKKGLHVYIPLNFKKTTFAGTKQFSRLVAELMERNYPGLITAAMAKELRANKVFINWSQNDAAKTMVCAYSLRAEKAPLSSCPLAWAEVKKWRNQPDKFRITHQQAVERIEKMGDLFSIMTSLKQELPRHEAKGI